MLCAKVECADCMDVMRQQKDASVDALVSDPPYGLGKEPNPLDVLKCWLEGREYKPTGSGFMGKKWDAFVPDPLVWREAYRVLKPGAHALVFAGTRTPDWVMLSLRLAGFEIRDTIAWIQSQGWPKGLNAEKGFLSIGDTKEAEIWKDWNTTLRPSVEFIVMARKPLDGSVTDNLKKYGVGALNIGACRLPVGADDRHEYGVDGDEGIPAAKVYAQRRRVPYKQHASGRWPPNVVLDESAAIEVDDQGGRTECSVHGGNTRSDEKHQGWRFKRLPGGFNDSGWASRFFYVSKANTGEREFGLNGNLECVVCKKMDSKTHMLDGSEQKCTRNNHVSVKPVSLMRHLVKLVTPMDGLCFDPFAGTGSTGIACVLSGFNFLGAEIDQNYARIAELRLAAAQSNPSFYSEAHVGDKIGSETVEFVFSENGE